MRSVLLAIGLLGVLMCGGIVAVSFARPLLIERAARAFIRHELEQRTRERIDALADSRIAGWATSVLKDKSAEIERSVAAIRADLPGRVANVIADMMRADCACRQRLTAYLREAESTRLQGLLQARQRLTTLIESGYAHVSRELLREARVFFGANATAFLLLLLVTWRRRAAALQLALPAAVLLTAMVVTASFYLFGQNWFHTIVFSDYVGLAYAGYLAIVTLGLADVAFNRARVTTPVINAILHAVGSALSAVPC